MLSLLNTFKATSLVSLNCKEFNFTCPSSYHNKVLAWSDIIMFNLIGIKCMQFLTFHRPYIKSGICLTACSDYEFLILWNINCRSIALENVSIKFFNFLEINTLFSYKFVIDNSFVKTQWNVVIFCTNKYSSRCVVI